MRGEIDRAVRNIYADKLSASDLETLETASASRWKTYVSRIALQRS